MGDRRPPRRADPARHDRAPPGRGHPRRWRGLASADVGDGYTPRVDPYLGPIPAPATLHQGFEDADYAHGTLLAAHRDCLAAVGLFDERYFAYCEEADLGIRARAAGWRVGVVRGVAVANPEMGPAAAWIDYLQLRNTLLLLREHHGRRYFVARFGVAVVQILGGLMRPGRRSAFFSAGPESSPCATRRSVASARHPRGSPPSHRCDGPSRGHRPCNRPSSTAASAGRTRRRYHSEITIPATSRNPPSRIATIHRPGCARRTPRPSGAAGPRRAAPRPTTRAECSARGSCPR